MSSHRCRSIKPGNACAACGPRPARHTRYTAQGSTCRGRGAPLLRQAQGVNLFAFAFRVRTALRKSECRPVPTTRVPSSQHGQRPPTASIETGAHRQAGTLGGPWRHRQAYQYQYLRPPLPVGQQRRQLRRRLRDPAAALARRPRRASRASLAVLGQRASRAQDPCVEEEPQRAKVIHGVLVLCQPAPALRNATNARELREQNICCAPCCGCARAAWGYGGRRGRCGSG